MRVAGFNSIIHPEQRILICAFLLANSEVAFSVLRQSLDMTDSGLSKQIKVLADAGYVSISKEGGVPRPRRWLALTPAGREATEANLAALRGIVESRQGTVGG